MPELYVIYTGDIKRHNPEKLTLRESFFEGENICVECEIKILYDGAQGDIINQYVRFCHVFNEQIRLCGRTSKAVEETIMVCRNEEVLKEYLDQEQEEIMDMMLSLFDEETLMKNHDANIERKSRKDIINLFII